MHRYKKLLLPLATLLLVPLAASAQVPELAPLRYETRYDITLGGLAIGRLRITAMEDTFGYRMSVDTKTRGIVDFFAPLKSLATVRGAITEEGEYLPTLYTSKADKDGDDKDRKVSIAYDDEGRITTRSRVPGDDPKWRPVVPLDKASAALDPMTGFFVLRKTLRDAMANEQREASVTTYDGARLATMRVKVVSRARIEVQGKHVNAINAVVTRYPIDGYTPKELKKYKEGDPVVHVYFSADERLMPLVATISLFYGDVRAELTEYTPVK